MLVRSFLAAATLAATAAGSTAAAATATVPGTLRAAILVPAGGDFAPHNALIANGAQIAATESGVSGGDVGPVRITLTRARFAADASPAAVMSTLASRGIRVVVLPCNVDATPALAAAGAKRKLLMLAPCDPSPKTLARVPMTWPTAMAGNAEVAQLVGYASQENATTAFVLGAKGSAYSTALGRYFREAAKLDHVRVAGSAAIDLPRYDVANLAARIRRSKARAIFTSVFSPHVEPLVAGLRAHGVDAAVYATDGMDAGLRLARYAAALDGVNFASFGFSRPAGARFAKDYRGTFGQAPAGSFPRLGYETIRILDRAAARAGSTDPARIDAAFARGFTVTGVALADVTYPGHGVREPLADAAVARAVRGAAYPLFASDPRGTVPVPAP
jgi:ABC-type branched-subunit amino acid transport system substrate-binding protein